MKGNETGWEPKIREKTLILLVASATLVLLALKLAFAARLDLYSDEIFYWLASTRLSLAYSDLPFMTALLVWLGTALDPGNTLAVRLPFLILGSMLPGLVYWLARPITGHGDALIAALLVLCIPLGGFLGLLAVPDVPLLFFGVLSLGCFERALRTNRWLWWMLTGLAVALGLATHYRFLLYPLAALLYLLAFRPARHQWRNPRLWAAIGIATTGLVPVLWFNLTNQLASASFYLVERHPWQFQPAGLLHLFKQAGLVTPPLYLLLLATLWLMIRRAREGESPAALLTSFALVNLLVYLLLAPWTDASSTSIHWPLSGYFPLLVFAPLTLRSVYGRVCERWGARKAVLAATLIPAIGFFGALVGILAIGSQAYQAPLQAVVGPGVLSNKMAGWREFSAVARRLLQDEFVGQQPVVVTDNYYTAAQVLFAGIADEAYTLDNDKAVRDGRELQTRLWGMDGVALTERAGRPLLYVTEDSTLTVPDKELALGEICRHVDDLRYLSGLSLFGGDKAFSFYTSNRVLDARSSMDARARPCPFPPRGWIDPPVAGAILSGIFHVEGWAYNEDLGLDALYLLLDGERIAEVNYGILRPDVVEVMNVTTDPNAPYLGYELDLDTTRFADGEYLLSIEMVDSFGVSTRYGERPIVIDN